MRDCEFREWNVGRYFKRLLDINRLAISYRFQFCSVSGLQGLEDMLHLAKNTANFFAVSDISDGYMQISDCSPHSRCVRTCFMAMRHQEGNMEARNRCMEIMRELFRQLVSVLSHDMSMLYHHHVNVSERIAFNEIEYYFFSGCACSFFNITIDYPLNLCISKNEWTESPISAGRFDPEGILCACFQHNNGKDLEGENQPVDGGGHRQPLPLGGGGVPDQG